MKCEIAFPDCGGGAQTAGARKFIFQITYNPLYDKYIFV